MRIFRQPTLKPSLKQFFGYVARGAGIGFFCVLLQATAAAQPFAYEGLVERARQLAGQDFNDSRGGVPEALKDLSYDEYQSINYNADKALWKDEGLFTVQFFHPGFYFDRTVAINIVENGVSSKIAFSPDMFRYRNFDPSGVDMKDLGFAGFRIHYPLHTDA